MNDTQITKAPDCSVGLTDTEEAFVKPHYLVTTNDDSYTVDVMLPGVPKDAIEATIDDGFLTVTGRRDNAIPEGWKTITREIDTTNYRLRLKVNARIDEEGLSARTEDGVLSLVLPKLAEDQPRKIEIA